MDRQPARPICPTHPATRLGLALVLASAVALAPGAAAEEMAEWEREMEVEATCLDWQKVRRCADEAGDLQYECVAKSPFAKFWALVTGNDRKQDDEVRVVKVRKGPDETEQAEVIRDAEARAEAAAGAAEANGTGTRESGTASIGGTDSPRNVKVKRVVREGDLPRCSDGR
ncbi:MAG TPA: hypothetical protein VHQ65_03025 [Thermoanaerobaculia bacterium]|nr:hypothetical protein [Thermoanaerobaculia bacterium]